MKHFRGPPVLPLPNPPHLSTTENTESTEARNAKIRARKRERRNYFFIPLLSYFLFFLFRSAGPGVPEDRFDSWGGPPLGVGLVVADLAEEKVARDYGHAEAVLLCVRRRAGDALLLIISAVAEVVDLMVDRSEKSSKRRLLKLKTGVAVKIEPKEKVADRVTVVSLIAMG